MTTESHEGRAARLAIELAEAQATIRALRATSSGVEGLDSKDTESALSASARRYRLLVESRADVVFITDPTLVSYVSPAVSGMFGFAPADLLGKDPVEFIHPEDVAALNRANADILLHPETTGCAKVRARHADGTYRIVELVARNLLSEPTVAGIVVNVHDVSERERAQEELKRSEAELRESRATLEAAQAVAHVGSWVWNIDGDAISVEWSKETCRIVGIAPADFGGRPEDVRALVHPDDLAMCVAAADATLKGGARYAARYRICRSDGAQRWVESEGVIERPAEGRPWRVIGTVLDITERKQNEEELLRRERQMRGIFDGALDAMFLADDDARYTDVNAAALRLLGRDRSDVIGRTTAELFPLGDPVVAWRRFLAAGTVNREITLGTGENQRHFRLLGTANVFPGGHLGILHDVTEREGALAELRRSEAVLRESRATLEKAQAIAHIGSWTIEHRGAAAVMSASAETVRIYGFDPATFDGNPHSLIARLDPGDWARGSAAIALVSEKGGPFAFDARVHRGGDEPGWVRLEGIVEAAADGKPPRILGTTLDITAARRAEEELRASEARYRRIIETTSEGVWLIDAERKTTFVNRRMAEMLGYSAEEMVGRRAVDFTVSGGPSPATERHLQQLREGTAPPFELCLRTKEGAPLWAQLATTPLHDEAGTYDGALAMVTDITGRRQADELRARFAAIVESSGDAIASTSRDGTILTWNAGAERLFGYSASEVIGRPASMLEVPGQEHTIAAVLAPVIAGERLDLIETARRRKDGSVVELSLALSPMRDSDGMVVGISAIARDITERRRAERAERSLRETEEQLRQAQKLEALGQLAGGVAHDFNNILSVILGYTAVLLDDLPEHDPIRIDIAEINEAGLRASGLTRQLLAFSRKQVLQPRVVELDALVTRNQTMLQRLLGEGVELLVIEAPGRKAVRADPGQLEQVLLNLAINARDAMPSGGRLTIETSLVALGDEAARTMGVTPGAYVTLAVTDTGAGMDEAVRAHIFEPFFTTKDVGKGTGLGLSTVFGIVKQSAGHVLVTSRVGAGTTFQVLLPATTEPPEVVAPPAPDDAPAARPGETVLLVEDDAQVRGLARNVLQRAGYRVLEAANAGEALLISEQHEGIIHAMLTDVVMPRMGGHQLVARLREVRPNMRALYMSGHTDDTVLHHGAPRGQLAFLAKPFTPTLLCKKMREVLDEAVAK